MAAALLQRWTGIPSLRCRILHDSAFTISIAPGYALASLAFDAWDEQCTTELGSAETADDVRTASLDDDGSCGRDDGRHCGTNIRVCADVLGRCRRGHP